MSKHINQSGTTTYFTLDSVASSLWGSVPSSLFYTMSIWTKADSFAVGNTFMSISNVDTPNMQRIYSSSSGPDTMAFQTFAGGTSAVQTFVYPGTGWHVYVMVMKILQGASGFDGGKHSEDGGTLSSALANAGTAGTIGDLIDGLTVGGIRFNGLGAINIAADRKFAYFGLWQNAMSQANVTRLLNFAPYLVDTSNLLFATDADLAYVDGTEVDEFTTVGADVATSTDNPSLILTDAPAMRSRKRLLNLTRRA